MEVRLMNSRDSIDEMEYNAAYGMLTCHDNTDKLQNEEPSEFIKRAIKAHHDTVLEHITLTFEINKLSRACLQELSRHRHISLSVESTRHTLKKQLTKEFVEEHFEPSTTNWRYVEAIHFLFFAQNHERTPNDELKYFLPELWPTNLVITLNIRELRHILKLRTSPAALKEFQDLCHAIFKAVPEDYRYMLEDCVHFD